MFKQSWRRLVVVLAAHILGTAAIALLYPVLGTVAGIFTTGAVLVGAFCFGLRGGLAAALVQTVLNSVAMQLLTTPPEPFNRSAAIGIGFMFLSGAAVGRQRDLSRRLRHELIRNEGLRVRERETLAVIPDVMVRVGRDGACLLQGAEVPGDLPGVMERVLGRTDQQVGLVETIERVRSTGHAEGMTFEAPGAVCYDVRCLRAADASVLVVFRDVTEQHRLLRRVAAAENLASLGTMAAGLAHEVNNPLTYIISNIDNLKMLLREAGRDSSAELDATLEGCWRIRDLVKSMLDTTTLKRDAVEPVSVSDVVEAALALVRPQVRHRATIEWSPPEDLYAAAHRTRLVQVVSNLVVNASQSFGDNRAGANEIRLQASGEGSQVVIEVADNGAGMDEATRLRVLEPFFTTKEPGKGTGLGLFLCNSIIESLDGTLQIESEPGRGTKVTVRLPMSHVAPAARQDAGRVEGPSHEVVPRLRVLVVDDEPEIRRALRRILSHKHEVTLCGDGTEALERLTAGERYDAILCDLLMPEMTGIELFKEIDSRFHEQAERMVFLTGGATGEGSRIFIEEQRSRVVGKPFSPTEIVEAVMARARLQSPPVGA